MIAPMIDPARLVFPGFTVGKQDPREAEALARLGVGGFQSGFGGTALCP